MAFQIILLEDYLGETRIVKRLGRSATAYKTREAFAKIGGAGNGGTTRTVGYWPPHSRIGESQYKN